jgi:hypothetical protein
MELMGMSSVCACIIQVSVSNGFVSQNHFFVSATCWHCVREQNAEPRSQKNAWKTRGRGARMGTPGVGQASDHDGFTTKAPKNEAWINEQIPNYKGQRRGIKGRS